MVGVRKHVWAEVKQKPDHAGSIGHIIDFRLYFGVYPKVKGS